MSRYVPRRSGVAFQPILGRVADVAGYLQSYVVSSGLYALAVPLVYLAHRQNKGVPAGEAQES